MVLSSAAVLLVFYVLLFFFLLISLSVGQRQRILRPLVPETLLRASSLRSRGALCNERKRRVASGSEALSPLRLSIEGNRVGHTL